MSDEQADRLNVVVVSFDEDSKAYEALTSLKELDSQRQLELRAAAVVVRDNDGKVIVKEDVGESFGVGVAAGGRGERAQPRGARQRHGSPLRQGAQTPGQRGRSGDRRRPRGPADSGEGRAQAAAQGAPRAAPGEGRREDRGAQGAAPPAPEGDHGTEHLSGRTRVGQDPRPRRDAQAVGTGSGTPAVSGQAECSPISSGGVAATGVSSQPS